jgi:hypothetical protein
MHPTPPIIVGITGKRDLHGKDGVVRQSILAAFQLLDEALPASRKLLLSAFAIGADTLAAEEALARPNWSVIAVLPFGVETYAQDFDAAGAEKLRALLRHPRVTLRPLTALVDPLTDQPFSEAALARAPGKSSSERSDHYEQVGLFIAERCALLIGVMDADEAPDKVGGTARIVNFRLRGMPDEVTTRVIGRSRELRRRAVLDCPATGALWLIDLATVGAHRNPLRAVALWRPVRRRVTTRYRALDLTLRLLGLARGEGAEEIVVEKAPWRREHDLVHGVRMLQWLESFNASTGKKHWRAQIAARKIAGEDAPAVLRWRRAALSMIQSRKKKLWQWAVRGLGGLFLAAVFLLEMHLEFGWHVGVYLGVFGAILVVYVWAAVLKLQQFVEDYRAVSEALRIQLVWWDAGLVGQDYCVDSYYLVGSTGSLGMVRSAARLLIVAAELECPPPAPVASAADAWINGQIKFFDGNIHKRQTKVVWSDDLTWFCFIGSVGMATVLFERAAEPLASIGDWLEIHWVIYLIGTLVLLLAARVRSLGDEDDSGTCWRGHSLFSPDSSHSHGAPCREP